MIPQKKLDLKEYIGDRYVLVADPSANFRDSIRRFLENLDVKSVKLVSSFADAQRELITTKVGFFIVEWVLPDKNALEFCRHIRQKPGLDKVPFLLITTENLRKDVILASEAGIDGYLLKPFSYTDFYNQVNEIVRARRNPSRLNQLVSEGERLLQSDRYKEAEKFFRKAIEEKPESARALAGLGKIAMHNKQTPRAIEYFEKAILNNPDFIEAFNYLLDNLEEVCAVERYVSVAEQAHRISPDNPRYTLILAKGCFDLEDYEMSEKYFRKTLILSPKLAEAYKGLGNVFLEKEEYDKAIKNFHKALDLEPSDISLLNALGTSYVRKNFITQGIDHYRLALKIDAFDHRVLFNLGYAYEKLGDIAKARTNYEKALASDPDFDKAQRRLEAIMKSSAS